ncbi:MAG: hypothetical protein KA802_11450 [Saprospiraceae bacterium]|nr:hypothetical protein [Saprospiraceae bacterium]
MSPLYKAVDASLTAFAGDPSKQLVWTEEQMKEFDLALARAMREGKL